MENEGWVPPVLRQLRAEGRERTLNVLPRAGGRFSMDGREYLNFSCNDYLDLSRDPRVLSRAAETMARYGAGAGASRLVTGTLDCHAELEAALASFQSYPAAIVFGSGCLANVGVLSTVLGRSDVVFADRLVHATIIDGIVLSRAKLYRFPHNDIEQLDSLMTRAAAARRPAIRFLVATESVFSMDGDRAPLRALCEVASRHEAMLLVDEAHALGVFGPHGAGLVREHGLGNRVNACTATLSKAMGSYGGFVACSTELQALPDQPFSAVPVQYGTSARQCGGGPGGSGDHSSRAPSGTDVTGAGRAVSPTAPGAGVERDAFREPDHSFAHRRQRDGFAFLCSTEGQGHPRHSHPRADGAARHGADPSLGDIGARRRGFAAGCHGHCRGRQSGGSAVNASAGVTLIAGWAQTEQALRR